VFTDIRVRAALAKLGSAPSSSLISVVAGALEGPAIEGERLRASLDRILGRLVGSSSVGAVVGSPPPLIQPKTGTAPPKGHAAKGSTDKKVYDLEHHVSKKPAAIVDLFEELDAFAASLGPDVVRRPTKYYIGYYAGKKSFFTAELQKGRIWIYLSLPPSEATPWDAADMRDVTKVGHFGMGDTELNLTSTDQMQKLQSLLKQSYVRNRK